MMNGHDFPRKASQMGIQGEVKQEPMGRGSILSETR
jgi:hypothetical protein